MKSIQNRKRKKKEKDEEAEQHRTKCRKAELSKKEKCRDFEMAGLAML